MYFECRHVAPSGRKCKDPLLQNSTFCYHHRNLHELMYAPPARPGTPFRMPLLEDAQGCTMGIQQVCWAMGEKRITPQEATIYLRAVSLTKSLLPKRANLTRKPVRTLCYDNDGFEMAEEATHCEAPVDCLTCKKPCAWYEYYEDEIEVLKQQIKEEQNQKAGANPDQQPAPDSEKPSPKPWEGKYDHERPNVRAFLERIVSREYKELEQQQQARLNEKKDPQPDKPAPVPIATLSPAS